MTPLRGAGPTTPRCADCRHFDGGGAAVEAAFPGLSALSSGYASVRGGDGLCARHDLYLPGDAGCPSFSPRPLPSDPR